MKKLRFLCSAGIFLFLLMSSALGVSGQDSQILCEKYGIPVAVEQAYRTYCAHVSEQNEIPMLSLETFSSQWDASIPLETYVHHCAQQNQKTVHHTTTVQTPIREEEPPLNSYSSSPPSWWNDVMEPPHKVSYDTYHLLEKVIEGDILYESKGFGHSAIIEGTFYSEDLGQYYIRVIEAIPEPGVSYGILCDERMQARHGYIDRPSKPTRAQMHEAVYFMKLQVGKKYSLVYSIFEDAVKIQDQIDPNKIKKEWYCSLLVYTAYQQQGILLVSRSAIITPKHLHNGNVIPITNDIYEK